MDPTFIAVGMLHQDPFPLFFQNAKRDAFFNRKQDFILGPGTGAEIADIASGYDGGGRIQKGLVDRIGGLLPALDEIKEKAGIPKDEKVIVDVYPRKKRFVRLPGMGASSRLKKYAFDQLLSILPKDIRAMIPILRSNEPLAIMPYRLKIF